jgi:hypothetical protein
LSWLAVVWTDTDFQALIAAADFEVARILPLPEAVEFSAIEAIPA